MENVFALLQLLINQLQLAFVAHVHLPIVYHASMVHLQSVNCVLIQLQGLKMVSVFAHLENTLNLESVLIFQADAYHLFLIIISVISATMDSKKPKTISVNA